MKPELFRPGFRLTPGDTIFIALVGIGSAAMWPYDAKLAGLLVLPCVQFFLYCNVFRIRRAPELIWAAAYLAVAGWAYAVDAPLWIPTTSLLILGGILIAVEMTHRSYHGVFWQRINPALPEWYAAQHSDL
ncbi:hypothetical protein [Stratiformator vulcanicus]|nr:hypothetical protein [Stratiformator vulcanicus]